MENFKSASEEIYYYKTNYELTKIFAIALAVAALFFGIKSSRLSSKVENLQSQIEEKEDWINRNENNASSTVYYCENADLHIDNMDIDDVISYVEDVTLEPVFLAEDAYGFAIYAFQKGYSNGRRGAWDEMTEYLVDGHEFSEADAKRYLNMLY